MTLEELEKELDEKVASGEMTTWEADMEYMDFLHRDEVWVEW